MRCVAGVGLLVLVGCNQIFGLTPARTWDAAIDVPLDMPHIVFTWQLATSQPSGAPAPALSYPPFTGGFSPQIRIATLDGAFEHADYLSSPGMEGWILVPRSYIGTTWRLEYTLPGGVPHEVQWSPDDKLGHLTVPMVGRVDRNPIPGGSGYTLTPTNYTGSYTFPRVFTTGLWTDGAVTAAFTGPTMSTVDYDFASATPLSGTSGRPDPAQGDRATLVDFVTDGTGTPCSRVASGSAAVDATLQAGAHTPQTVNWDTRRQQVVAPPVATGFVDRLTGDPLHGTLSATQSTLLYGAVPSTDFPGLTGTPAMLSQIALPIPVMQILLQCRYNRNPLPDTANPATLADFPRVLHVQLVANRMSLGANLTAGLETVIASSPGIGFKIEFPAPFATKMTLTTPTGVIDLSGPSDQIPIGSASGAFTLGFTPEPDPTLRADYHDVVLHRIDSGALTTERIFTVTAPQVRIDGALLTSGVDYVFEIRSYKGHVMAPHGDFVPVDYPYGAAIVFSRTFKAS